MKRNLISQMRNEWRGNIWMVIELSIVSLILWYLFTSIWSLVNVSFLSKGYDTSDLYFAEIHHIDENSDYFQPYDSAHSYLTDSEILLSKIRSNPYVEIVGTGNEIAVYTLNYWGSNVMVDSLEYHGNLRMFTPDAIRAYRLESLDGKTTEQLAEVIARGELILAEPDYHTDTWYNDPKPFVGKDVIVGGDSSVVRRVGAIAYGQRRTDYEPQSGVIYVPLPENYVPSEVVIRTVPGHGHDFIESLKLDDKRAGNLYLANLRSIDQRREASQLDKNIAIRNFLICAIFLLLVIFLGFLGTFWFRTQQRVDEIAVRIVNGATRGDIFRRFIGEGMIMLGVATVIVIPIEVVFIRYGVIAGLLDSYTEITLSSPEIYQAMGLTTLLLALLIVAGIWFPARKAMNINPADALKDQ